MKSLYIYHFLLLLLFSIVTNAQNFYDKTPNIIELSPSNFDKVVHKSNYTTLVEFYAPWCGHCQQLKSSYGKVSKLLKDLAVQVAAVNCDEAKNKQLCAINRVQGYPTLMVFRPPKYDVNSNGNRNNRQFKHANELYRGERSFKSITDFALSRIKNYVKKYIRPTKLVDALKKDVSTNDINSNRPKVVVLSKGSKISPVLKTLAIDWLGLIDFYMIPKEYLSVDSTSNDIKCPVKSIDDNNINIVDTFFCDELPNYASDSLLVVFSSGANGTNYTVMDSDKFSPLNINKFLIEILQMQPREGYMSKRHEWLHKQATKKLKNPPPPVFDEL
ncbi:protein disulfide isomerase MPD1 SCDLUD_000396 [Saccharomycodes ludwigii]|uniref:protein disulfide isomerase MPD1 n=1 Tax=Saccharomycodes ludwigii TaxID=36035 RepID=UPI001E85A60B|nr:hypothetical protein SCDLUD_000396 [Saccharomycodes ludwigii]KAH3902805.1 hypothetical protein SCDLUD_000396 [Saccharomycodes ludwigii]